MRKKMETEKLIRFLQKDVKVLADAGNGKVFTYKGKVTEVTDSDISIMSVKFGETILMNQLVLQITENGGTNDKT